MQNVFVVGLDDFNLQMLQTVRDAEQIRFHSLLDHDEVVFAEDYRVEDWMERAAEQLERFPERVDGIVGYWDFPTSTMRPLFRRLVGLPGPTLESILRCEHKVWARMEQKRVVPEHTPNFAAFDPFDEDPWRQIALEPPFWIKPVKAHSSQLGYRIDRREQFEQALPVIRERIGRFGRPFDWVLGQADLPEEIRGMGGHTFLAEEIISRGRQCTLEGYTWHGKAHVYGVVDSVREGRYRSSFSRYQYPSRIPARVRLRMADVAQRFIEAVELDQTPWNAEFYWNDREDTLMLLEVNTRCSQSHAPLFWLVDGRSHFEVMVDLALGREPRMPEREGPYRIAAKFMVRIHEPDGVVRRVPQAADVARVRQLSPGTLVDVGVREGMRLSQMQHQDSYSYEIADLFMGARNTMELRRHERRALEILDFEVDPVRAAA